VIASLSSLTSAIVIHELWKPGAILGAAITPIIVALVSEALKRPAERLTAARESGRRIPASRERDVPPVSRQRGDDPFGLWEDFDPRRRRGRTWLVLGLVTGVIAFAIAAFVLTGSELVLGGSVTGDRKTTIFGGSRTTTTVQTVTRTRTAPATVTQTVPAPATEEPAATATQTAPTAPQTAPEQAPQAAPFGETAPTTQTAPPPAP